MDENTQQEQVIEEKSTDKQTTEVSTRAERLRVFCYKWCPKMLLLIGICNVINTIIVALGLVWFFITQPSLLDNNNKQNIFDSLYNLCVNMYLALVVFTTIITITAVVFKFLDLKKNL